MSIDAPGRLHLCKRDFHYSNAHMQHDAGPDVKSILAGFGGSSAKRPLANERQPAQLIVATDFQP
jgi:hypothetical protein